MRPQLIAIDEAVAHINAGPRPLALYYFGGNGEDRRKMLEGTTSGNVTINDTLLHFANEAFTAEMCILFGSTTNVQLIGPSKDTSKLPPFAVTE